MDREVKTNRRRFLANLQKLISNRNYEKLVNTINQAELDNYPEFQGEVVALVFYTALRNDNFPMMDFVTSYARDIVLSFPWEGKHLSKEMLIYVVKFFRDEPYDVWISEIEHLLDEDELMDDPDLRYPLLLRYIISDNKPEYTRYILEHYPLSEDDLNKIYDIIALQPNINTQHLELLSTFGAKIPTSRKDKLL